MDASANPNLGWGSFAPDMGQFGYGQWPTGWFETLKPSIDCLVLAAVLISVFSLRHQLQNKGVTIFTDNMLTKEAVWSGTSPSK